MDEITKNTPHDELVKAIPPAYFAGELEVSDLSARELCTIFALISQDDIGAVGQEMMERLQKPPVAVPVVPEACMNEIELKEDQCRRIRAVAAVALILSESINPLLSPERALRRAANAVRELDRLPVPDDVGGQL